MTVTTDVPAIVNGAKEIDRIRREEFTKRTKMLIRDVPAGSPWGVDEPGTAFDRVLAKTVLHAQYAYLSHDMVLDDAVERLATVAKKYAETMRVSVEMLEAIDDLLEDRPWS